MSVTFLFNSLHCVGCLFIFTDSPIATGAFMTLGFLVDLQSSHAFPCSPGLVSVELEVDRANVLLE